MKYMVPLGRILYSLIFILTIRSHFSESTIKYAASAGVPAPELLVPLSGIVAITGGLSILLGYRAKVGAWLIIIFLIPVTFYMHAFWKQTDAMQINMQLGNFIKNVALLGSAGLISYFGAGPVSIDSRRMKQVPPVHLLVGKEYQVPAEFIHPRKAS